MAHNAFRIAPRRNPQNRLDVDAASLFGRYKKEPIHEVRKAEVKEDVLLEQLKEAWKAYCKKYDDKTWDVGNGITTIESRYKEVIALISGIDYHPDDVERFSIAVSQIENERFFGEKLGIFLTALINNNVGHDFLIKHKFHQDYTIHTHHIPDISCLGFTNKKNITVEGDVGSALGILMESGTIVINGNVVGISTCAGMRGGRVIINGDVMDYIGIAGGMTGGEIHINGRYKEFHSNLFAGRVYHNGKLIVDKTSEGE